MSTQSRARLLISGFGLIVVTLACAFPLGAPQVPQPTATATPGQFVPLSLAAGTATPTASPSTVGSIGGTGGSTGGSSSGTGGSNSGGNSGGSDSTGGNNGGSDSATPTELATINGGPYVVKQIETLGGEAISGIVCSVTQPFTVLSVTPHVTFTFLFVPQSAQQGKVSYAYSIKSAGESHDATGTYTVSPVGNDGTLQVSLTVSDHVVFKGFDGNIPNHYKFNLVPSGSSPCSPAP